MEIRFCSYCEKETLNGAITKQDEIFCLDCLNYIFKRQIITNEIGMEVKEFFYDKTVKFI